MLTWISKHVVYPLVEKREGAQRLAHMAELLKSQWLPLEDLQRKQMHKLRFILNYAYEFTDYYRTLFDDNNLRPGDIQSLDDLRKLPELKKHQVATQQQRLLSSEFNRDQLVEARTGGSTGNALTVYFDQRCQEFRNAASMRSDAWANWDLGMKKAAVWGNPPEYKTLKQKLRSALLERNVYLDTMAFNDQTLGRFIQTWRSQKPQVIFGHAHSIYLFAKYVLENKLDDIRPLGIIATSMMLLPQERTVIEQAFGCKVTDRYGCEEVGLIGCQCEKHLGMHLNIDHLVVEFINERGEAAKAGETATLVVTDLINRGMPMIRYRVEDMAVFSEQPCPCGRGLPVMEKLVGRLADFLVAENGTKVAGVSLVERTLTAYEGIEQMQIVQHDINRFDINLVKRPQFGADTEKALLEEMQGVFGDQAQFKLLYHDNIPQERSGKYRFAICKLPSVN